MAHRRMTTICRRLLLLWLAAALGAAGAPLRSAAEAEDPSILDGVVIAPDYATLYAPLAGVADALDLTTTQVGSRHALEGVPLPEQDQYTLPDDTALVRLRFLAERPELEVTVDWDPEKQLASVRRGERELQIRRGRRTVADGITFARNPESLYLPLPELRRALDLPAEVGTNDPDGVPERVLPDGTALAPVEALREPVSLGWFQRRTAARLTQGEQELWVRRGLKRVALNLREQRLRAWEGERLVLETRISSGRKGMETPQGTFRAGPIKSRMIISRKYGDAEMPWSVQVHRNVFIHGFTSVPPRAASHGCIRMPLTGGNPARWFYEWVTVGTPIRIAEEWPVAGE